MVARSSDRDETPHVAGRLPRRKQTHGTTHQSGGSAHLMSIDRDSWEERAV